MADREVVLKSRYDARRGKALCSWPGCKHVTGLEPNEAGHLLCSYHDPKRMDAIREKRAGKRVDIGELPVQEIENLDDALKLARWVPIAIATGAIGGREAAALVGALREFRMMVADAESLARVTALEERLKAYEAANKKG